MKDTRTIKNVKSVDVCSYFDRHDDIYNVGVQFIDFDIVELTVYDSGEKTQEEIDDIMDYIEDVIYNTHLTN